MGYFYCIKMGYFY